MASFSGIKNTLLAEQADEEAAPAHGPNLKSSKAPERYAPGPAVIFYGKKSCFPGRCGAYFLSTASAVTTMMRFVTCLPFLSTVL
jgi:hypothetical protein